jgi:hypothetical protein
MTCLNVFKKFTTLASDFLEHLMTCSTNSTKFFRARAIPNKTLPSLL